MQVFHRPAVLDEFLRQPIQQSRMRWSCTAESEIVNGANDSFTEVKSPNVIRGDSRCEWIVRAAEPPGELEPAALADRDV